MPVTCPPEIMTSSALCSIFAVVHRLARSAECSCCTVPVKLPLVRVPSAPSLVPIGVLCESTGDSDDADTKRWLAPATSAEPGVRAMPDVATAELSIQPLTVAPATHISQYNVACLLCSPRYFITPETCTEWFLINRFQLGFLLFLPHP
jgi:hypothetical protein